MKPTKLHHTAWAALALVLLSGCASKETQDDTLPIGGKIPEFSVTTTEGVGYNDQTFLGNDEYFSLFIFDTRCARCEALALQMKGVLPEYYPVLGLSASAVDDTREFIRKNGLAFLPSAAEVDRELIGKFVQGNPPAILVFNEDGLLVDRIGSEECPNELLLSRMVKDPIP